MDCLTGFQVFLLCVGAIVTAGVSGGFGALGATLVIRWLRND